MDCLSNLIGIRNVCGETTPNSLFYINDITGISIREADAAINDEYVSARDMIQKKITLAGDLIAQRIRTILNPRFKGISVIENSSIGFALDNQQVLSSAATYLIGKYVRMYSNEYLEFFLSRVGIFANTTGNISVFVYDLTQNKLLDTLTVAVVAGEISYTDVYKSYKTTGQDLNLFIGYTATFASYKTQVSKGNCSSCNYEYSNPYVSISSKQILSASSKINQNLESGNGDGLMFSYSLNCSFEPFICNMKHILAEAIWWKSAELILTEMRYSKRVNSLINVYEQDHNKLIEAYAAASEAALQTNISNMRIPDNDCFYCNKKVALRVGI